MVSRIDTGREVILWSLEVASSGVFAVFLQLTSAVIWRRSGKIMRRLLRKIAVQDDKLGDTSTLADPSVVDALIDMRGK